MLLEVLVLVVGVLVAIGLIVLLEHKLDKAYAPQPAAEKPAPAKAEPAKAPVAPPAPPAPVVESGIPAEVVAAIAAAVVSLEGAVTVHSIRKAGGPASRRGVWGDAGVLANTTPFMA